MIDVGDIMKVFVGGLPPDLRGRKLSPGVFSRETSIVQQGQRRVFIGETFSLVADGDRAAVEPRFA